MPTFHQLINAPPPSFDGLILARDLICDYPLCGNMKKGGNHKRFCLSQSFNLLGPRSQGSSNYDNYDQ
jgi:hypothetical protein